MGYTLGALSSSDEELTVALAKPLKKGKALVAASSSIYTFNQGSARPITNRMTELGLLHLLWERAGLHEYNSETVLGPLWPRIRRAAYGIKPKGLRDLKFGLSDIMLLPLHAETEEQSKFNYAKFKEAQDKGRFVLFIARLNPTEVASLVAAETSDFSLKAMFGINLSLYSTCAKPVLDALRGSFGTELACSQNDGDDLVVLGIAKPAIEKLYATISSVVVMPVVKDHLPYDSRYERSFACELVRQGRSIRKPLRYEASRDMQVHPDFVLLDTPKPVVVEVYGMSTPDYLARKKEKQRIYLSEEYPFECWEWDAAECDNLTQWLSNHPLPT
jgi:hypothetical protein